MEESSLKESPSPYPLGSVPETCPASKHLSLPPLPGLRHRPLMPLLLQQPLDSATGSALLCPLPMPAPLQHYPAPQRPEDPLKPKSLPCWEPRWPESHSAWSAPSPTGLSLCSVPLPLWPPCCPPPCPVPSCLRALVVAVPSARMLFPHLLHVPTLMCKERLCTHPFTVPLFLEGSPLRESETDRLVPCCVPGTQQGLTHSGHATCTC